MRAIVLKCPRGSRFHFGNIALDENTSLNDTAVHPHSDTLFSAIINTAHLLEPGLTNELVDQLATGAVRLSSGYFCLENRRNGQSQWIYFLPKPTIANLIPLKKDSNYNFKQIRNLEFLSKAVWEAGYLPENWFNEEECTIINDRFVLTKAEADELPLAVLQSRKTKPDTTQTYPKVKVHDLDQQDGFFHQTSVQLGAWSNRQAGWETHTHYYFLLEGELEGRLHKLLDGAIYALQDQGIGGERSVGCGWLSAVEEHEFSWNIPFGDWTAGLSLVNPAAEMDQCKYYQTIMRGGRRLAGIGTETYLQRVRMIREGAVLKTTMKGALVPIGPAQAERDYRRYGLHLGAPLHQNMLQYVG